MILNLKFSISLLFLVGFICISGLSNTDNEAIRKHVEDITAGRAVVLMEESIYSSQLLPKAYTKREFEPIWDSKSQDALIKAIASAPEDGLNSEDYHFEALTKLDSKKVDELSIAAADILLTDAYLLYASHLLNGKTNPETIDGQWKATRREGNALEHLEKALSDGKIGESLGLLRPNSPRYYSLREALNQYRKIADLGGWSVIPDGQTLKVGMIDSIRIPALIARLRATNDLNQTPANTVIYSESVQRGVLHFQKRHGLETDGDLGRLTTTALNVPVAKRVDQIKLNMERYRWLSQNLGNHYAMVNIADFHMSILKNDSVTFREKVIVGKPFRKTPVFSGNMTYMVLNPTWTVPKTILLNDILPQLQKDPIYLSQKKMKAFDLRVSTNQAVDPATVNWNEFSKNYFPFMIRQEPGELNALGLVKFMFPNGYDVYVHDTPNRDLFSKNERIFSSGCIRLDNPFSLVNYHLSKNKDWTMAKVQEVIKGGQTTTINLKESMPIHILYLTAWAEDGLVQFRSDIYQRDTPLSVALNEKAPSL